MHSPKDPGADRVRRVRGLRKKKRFGTRRWHKVLVWMCALAAISSVYWHYSGQYYWRDRAVRVMVYADPEFRNLPGWEQRIRDRFKTVNRLYSQSKLVFNVVDLSRLDPANGIVGINARRQFLADRRREGDEELTIEITGRPDDASNASVFPFSRAAVIVNRAEKSELENATILAHELAHLFGAPEELDHGTLMGKEPTLTFSPRTASLIRALRHYEFAHGTQPLEGRWEEKAVKALAAANVGISAHPVSSAHWTIAAALLDGERVGPGVAHLRAALADDPGNELVRFQLAKYLSDRQQVDEAVEMLREGVRRFPSAAHFHAALGALLVWRDREAAIEELRSAVRLQPGNAAYHNALGIALAGEPGKDHEAVSELESALRIAPGMQQAKGTLELLRSKESKRTGGKAAGETP